MRPGAVLFPLIVALSSASEAADDQPICADRPGVATPTCTVPPGTVQVEIAIVDWVHDRSDAVHADGLAIAQSALKFGISDRFHIELDISPYLRERESNPVTRSTASGFGDMRIAAKYRLSADGSPVELAVLPFLKLPTARRALGNGEVEGGLIVPVSYAIPHSSLSIGLSPELDLAVDGDGSGRHLAMSQVVGLSFPLGRKLSGSAELWGSWDFDPGGTVRQYGLAASGAYLVSNDLQVDAGVAFGVSRDAPDLELYSGLALRF